MEKKLREKLHGGKFRGVTPERSRIMRSVKSKENLSTERRLRSALVRGGIRGWRVRPTHLPGKPDFFFPLSRVAVFVDGCFWHGCPKCGHIPSNNRAYWAAKIKGNRLRDARNNTALDSMNVHVLRFWEHAIRDSPEQCIIRIRRAIDQGSASPRTHARETIMR